MKHDRALHGSPHIPHAGTYGAMPSRSKSLLPGATVLCILAVACATWEVIHLSPDVVLLSGLAAISCINYLSGGRDVLYPAFTYSAIWTLVSAAFAFCPIAIDPMGWKTVWVLLAGAAAFSAGSLLGNRPLMHAGPKETPLAESVTNRDNPQARNILLGCALLVTLLFFINIVKIAGGIFGITPAFLLKLNLPGSPLEDADPFTSILIGSGGLVPVLALWVLLMEEKRKWKITLCVLCVCLFPLFVTQRGLIMLAFCGYITLFLLKRKDRSFAGTVKPLSIAASFIIVAMMLLSITKPWVQQEGRSLGEGAWIYIAGPLATFNYFLYHPGSFAGQPAAVFSQILTPLSHLGLVKYRTLLEVDGSKFDRFVYVPFPGNVYTAYKPYYQDFGASGCFAAFVLFGFIEGRLFYAAVRGNRIAVFFFAYLSASLMFSTFDDSYHSFSRHLNMLVFAVGYFWILKRTKFRLA